MQDKQHPRPVSYTHLNETRDDAAVYDLGNGTSVISTTDFFMPIVDNPFDFGRIAATNAISDIFAMGGKPIMAIAILGWPINKLSSEIAREVTEGGRYACRQAGIALAGGHSIDAPEPIFGLAVTGIVPTERVKKCIRDSCNCQLKDFRLYGTPLRSLFGSVTDVIVRLHCSLHSDLARRFVANRRVGLAYKALHLSLIHIFTVWKANITSARTLILWRHNLTTAAH